MQSSMHCPPFRHGRRCGHTDAAGRCQQNRNFTNNFKQKKDDLQTLLPELQLPTSTFASSMRKTHLPGQPTLVVSSTLTTSAVRDPGMLKQRLPSPALKPAWEESNKRETAQTIDELQTRCGMRSRSCWTCWPAVRRLFFLFNHYLHR